MADADVQITAGSGTKVDTRTVGAGTDEHRQVVVVGDPSTAAGVAGVDATNGLDVDVTRVVPGTGATELGKAEDAVHATGDVGVMPLAVRADTAAATAANGDYHPLLVNANGALHVSVGSLPTSTNTIETVGDTAEDNALVGNPLRQGVRAHSGVPAAMSADNDVVTPWADRSGAQAVIPQPRQVDLQGIPTLGTTTNYDIDDFMGTVITFTGAALATGRAGQVVSAVLLDRANQKVPLKLLLFRASPTVASADNATISITAANMATARYLGTITFSAGDYTDVTSAAACPGELVRGPISYVTSGSANIFGVLVAGGVYNAAAAGDIEINLVCNQF